MTEPLVVIPGFMADARGFLPQIADLGADRAITVILPNAAETIEQMSLAALPALPQHFALLGHGLGGDLAIDLMRRMPERVGRIALVSTDPLSEPPAIAAAREARLVAARAGRLADALGREMPADALAETDWRDEILSLVQDMGLRLGLASYVRQTRALQRRPDQQKTLRRFRVPALVLAGQSDPIVPVRRQEFLAGMMPQGRLVVIADAGHMPQLEQPETVTAALRDFLAGPLVLR